jgi:hypothetical protein
MGPIEPSAQFRELAHLHAQIFNSYTLAGFNPDQALQILLALIAVWAPPRQ